MLILFGITTSLAFVLHPIKHIISIICNTQHPSHRRRKGNQITIIRKKNSNRPPPSHPNIVSSRYPKFQNRNRNIRPKSSANKPPSYRARIKNTTYPSFSVANPAVKPHTLMASHSSQNHTRTPLLLRRTRPQSTSPFKHLINPLPRFTRALHIATTLELPCGLLSLLHRHGSSSFPLLQPSHRPLIAP